jgi:alpha-methylacyl-CoA racemase
MQAAMAGPLRGIRIVEMGGIGPAPFAAMMLADHGAEVIRVERAGMIGFENDPHRRSRRSISLDLKQPAACEIVRRLTKASGGLIEGYRPGVMERLGLGPEDLLRVNSNLVYGRVTGWGQTGPLAQEAGHDINYIALSGLLHGIGPKERPIPPINYLGDYAGGGMMLAFGMVSALLAVKSGGSGQVVDAAMSEGAALIGAMTYGMLAAGVWKDEREANLLDGGTQIYGTYRCSDGKFLAIGAIEPQFQQALFRGLALDAGASREEIATVIKSRTRDDWVNHFAGTDACVAPVLDLGEAPVHPHNIARRTFLDVDGVFQPAPAPRYSSSQLDRPDPPRAEGEDAGMVLGELGYTEADIARLRAEGVLL